MTTPIDVRTRQRNEPRRPAQGLVEFAFVLPAILLLLMGVVDFGRGIFYYNMLSNAARDGARAGIVDSTTTALSSMCEQAFARALLPGVESPTCPGSGATSATVTAGTLTATLNAGTAGDPTQPNQVTLTYTFTPVTPFIDAVIGLVGGGSITLTASSQMYVES